MIRTAFAIAALTIASAGANATVLTFEDVGVPAWKTDGPFQTKGFIFYGADVLDISGAQPAWTPDGYGAHSGSYAVLQVDMGLGVVQQAGQSFSIADLWVKRWDDSPGNVTFTGLLNGQVANSLTIFLTQGSWTQVALNFNNINNFGMAGAMVDDIRINAPLAAVPEPETYAMLAAGLGLMGFIARRRRKSA